MKNLRSEEEKIIKNIRNLFRLEKKLNDTAIKHIRNLFKLKKEIKGIKYIVLKDIMNLLEHKEEEEENYYKPVKVNNFWSNNYIEYKSDSNINKRLSVKEYLNKITPYLKDINDLKKFDTWKIQLTIANNFISSLDNDEECVMHSKNDNTEIMINDEEDEIIEELFDSLKNRYQNDFELMGASEFVFDCLFNVSQMW